MQRWKVENYMKTIYLLQKKGSVRGADLAEELGVARATVSVSLKTLEQDGYLRRLTDHTVVLTPKGMGIALEIADRNKRIYDMLVGLGVDKHIAKKDACSMEHAISKESFCALVALAAAYRANTELFSAEL